MPPPPPLANPAPPDSEPAGAVDNVDCPATAADPPPPQSDAKGEKEAAAAAGKARDVTRVVKIIKQNEPLVSECRDSKLRWMIMIKVL